MNNPNNIKHSQFKFRCRCFRVFNPIGEEWEQESIAFETFNEAKAYYDRQDKRKNPNLRIFAELSWDDN